MSVTASTPVSTGSTPSNPDQLWMLAFLFAANWTNGVKLHQAYMTDVVKAVSDCEQRRGLIQTPARTLEFEILVTGAEQIGYFRSFLMRAATCRSLVPLYPDALAVAGVPSSTSLTLSGTATDRRFSPGGQVAVVRFSPDNDVLSLTACTVVSAVGTLLTISGAAFTSGAIGYKVFPLIEADLALELSSTILTGSVLQATLTFTESRGVYSLDPLQAIGSTPSSASFMGYQVLTIDPDLAGTNKVGIQRSGEIAVVGRGKIAQTFGDRPRFAYELVYTQMDRPASVALIRHFESVGGRLIPFWLVSPCDDFSPVAFGSGTVTVKSNIPAIDWSYYPTIAVVLNTGVTLLRTVNSVTASGSNYILGVSAWPGGSTPTLNNLRKLCAAHLVRFDTDEMVEEWLSDGVMTSTLKMVEVPVEKNLTISNVKDFTGGYS